MKRRLDEAGPHFLRALCRCTGGATEDPSPSSEGWEVPWNPTVRNMTLLVLRELEGYYEELSPEVEGEDAFDRACEKAFSGGLLLHDGGTAGIDYVSGNNDAAKQRAIGGRGSAKIGTRPDDVVAAAPGKDMTTLRGGMGSWRPPPQKSRTAMPPTSRSKHPMQGGDSSSHQPPLTVTGVAPWTVGGRNRGVGQTTTASGTTSAKQPPLTVTGVAPWALNKQNQGTLASFPPRESSLAFPRPLKKHVSGPMGRPLPALADESVEVCIAEEDEEEDEIDKTVDKYHIETYISPALQKVRAYMERLKPPGDGDKSSDGISSWAKAQMEESPVLLPNLKFHDLVFGQELGTGAFSTVKYARQIVKDRTRSSWPEFAVKIVSTQKIEELGYEQSINREIAILRTLSHPGISRLISSFRFRDGAYLVLEYASGGDLHTLLRKNGSLDHESTRFVIGSVAAALWSIHELGFVYADCKPEVSVAMTLCQQCSSFSQGISCPLFFVLEYFNH